MNHIFHSILHRTGDAVKESKTVRSNSLGAGIGAGAGSLTGCIIGAGIVSNPMGWVIGGMIAGMATGAFIQEKLSR